MYGPICTETSHLYPGAIETLDGLAARGCQLGLVTNKPREFVDRMLKPLGLDERFQVVVAGDDLATKKPAPEMSSTHCNCCRSIPVRPALSVTPWRIWVLHMRRQSPLFLVRYGYHGDLDVDSAGVRVIDHLTALLEPA